MNFPGFDGDAYASGQGEFAIVDADDARAGFDEEDFAHVGMGVGGGDLSRGEACLGKVGQVGQVAQTQHDFFLDGGIVGDGFGGELVEITVFHFKDVFINERGDRKGEHPEPK